MFSQSAAVAGLAAVVVLVLAARWSFVAAQPDEWLLRIRDGKLASAGVGISLWRLPGDVVTRFSSTMQRVAFSVEALSQERLRVVIEGFILWSVSPKGDNPFRAFSKLGLADLNRPPADLKSRKHLLTSQQHHAFKALLAAEVQRLAATAQLERLLGDQFSIVAMLAERLNGLAVALGIQMDQVQLTHIRPGDEEVLRRLSAAYEEQVREDALRTRLETAERLKQREIESATRIAQEEGNAHRNQKAHQAQVELELAQRRAELLDAQHAVHQQQLEEQGARKLAQLEIDWKVKAREQELERDHALAGEAHAMLVTEARLTREDIEARARLEGVRREAEAQRDASIALAEAEERKSQPVRAHELARLVTLKVGDALAALPIHDARWVSIGNDSPAVGIAAALMAVQQIVRERPAGAGSGAGAGDEAA